MGKCAWSNNMLINPNHGMLARKQMSFAILFRVVLWIDTPRLPKERNNYCKVRTQTTAQDSLVLYTKYKASSERMWEGLRYGRTTKQKQWRLKKWKKEIGIGTLPINFVCICWLPLVCVKKRDRSMTVCVWPILCSHSPPQYSAFT